MVLWVARCSLFSFTILKENARMHATLTTEQSFRMKTRIQKLLVRNALASLSRRGRADAELSRASKDLIGDQMLFDEFYGTVVGVYCTEVDPTAAIGFDEESGTPILDKLIEFMKWAYESGFLELLLKLFFGIVMTDEDIAELDENVTIFDIGNAALKHDTLLASMVD